MVNINNCCSSHCGEYQSPAIKKLYATAAVVFTVAAVATGGVAAGLYLGNGLLHIFAAVLVTGFGHSVTYTIPFSAKLLAATSAGSAICAVAFGVLEALHSK